MPATAFTLLIRTANNSPAYVRDSLSRQHLINDERPPRDQQVDARLVSYPPSLFEPTPRTQLSTGHGLTGGVQHVTLGAVLKPVQRRPPNNTATLWAGVTHDVKVQREGLSIGKTGAHLGDEVRRRPN